MKEDYSYLQDQAWEISRDFERLNFDFGLWTESDSTIPQMDSRAALSSARVLGQPV
jgi:hypothetical protein